MKRSNRLPALLLAGALISACWLTLPAAQADDKQPQSLIPALVPAQSVQHATVVPESTTAPVLPEPDPNDMTRLAQTLWGECRGIPSDTRKAAVVWCVLNRVDDPRWPDTISDVCVHSQFNGYNPNNPVDPSLYDLAVDVWQRWQREKGGEVNVGRVLPKEYVFFLGDGKENHFTTEYLSGEPWAWELNSPYDN